MFIGRKPGVFERTIIGKSNGRVTSHETIITHSNDIWDEDLNSRDEFNIVLELMPEINELVATSNEFRIDI